MSLSVVRSNTVSVLHHCRDITTFTVYVTACNLVFSKTVKITSITLLWCTVFDSYSLWPCIHLCMHSIEQLTLLFLETENWKSVLHRKMVEQPCSTPCLISLVLEVWHWPCTTQTLYVFLAFCFFLILSENCILGRQVKCAVKLYICTFISNIRTTWPLKPMTH